MPSESWYLIDLENRTFGRALLKQEDPSLSARQFSITRKNGETWLEDTQSTNGTRRNKEPVQTCRLEPGDLIQCGRQTLVFLNPLFLIGQEPVNTLCPKGQEPVMTIPERLEIPAATRETMICERWDIPALPEKQPLLVSLSSSLMMTAGTLLSSALLAASGRTSPETLTTSMVMSLSMASSFLFASLIQRSATQKGSRKKRLEAIEEYRHYLAGLKQEITCIQQTHMDKQRQILARYERFEAALFQSDSPVPYGWHTAPLIQLDLPSLGYKQRQDPLAQELETLCQLANTSVQTLAWLPESGTVHCDIETVEALWCHVKNPATHKWFGPARLCCPHHFAGSKSLETDPDWHGASAGCHPAARLILQQDGPPPFNLGNPAPMKKREMPQPDHPPFSIRIGQDDTGQEIRFDLVKDGPHGLVCGRTGSGKSEALCLLLARLAENNPPETFQFLLLDFKGGSFAGPLANLPHCAGVCTNLEARGLKRLVLALRCEMVRRQERMNAFAKTHPALSPDLETYNRVEKDKLARLLIVCDEFAQLKTQFPEDLEFLQETARIGRSLGIHLILSTQKPSGIISPQIMANTSFIMCCQVQGELESLEVLGTRQAATLDRPGACIFQTAETSTRVQLDYIRQSIVQKDLAELWQGNHLVTSNRKQTSLLEALLDSNKEKKADPILLPELSDFQTDCLLAVDDVPARAQYGVNPHQTCICTNKPDEVKKALTGQWPSLFDLSRIPRTSWWFIDQMDGDQAVLLANEEDRSFFENPALRIFWITDRVPRLAWPEKLWTSLEDPLLIPDRNHPDLAFPGGWYQTEGTMKEIRFSEREREPEPVPLPDLAKPGNWKDAFAWPCLGHENGRPVFWNGGPLHFLGEEAGTILETWGIEGILGKGKTGEALFLSDWQNSPERWNLPIPPGMKAQLLLLHGGQCVGLEPLLHV